MTSRDFCYWMQGAIELNGSTSFNADQVKVIQDHLNMVFIHEIDPSIPDPAGKIAAAHAASKPPKGPGPLSDIVMRC